MKLHLKTFAVTWLMAPMFLSAQFHCVSFDALTLGTQYGDGINNQGDLIFTEDNIDVTVEYFEWPGLGTAIIVTIWFTIGGIKNLMEMIHALRTNIRDHSDSGFVDQE